MSEEKHDENLNQKIVEAVTNKNTETDYAAEFLADAARRAHDEELQALANIALIRSGFEKRRDGHDFARPGPPPSRQELEDRLRNILKDTDYHRG